MVNNIYMDESGYTGQDLYNPDQQVFVLASTDFTEEEAKELLAPIYHGFQGEELKHSVLARRSNGRQKIVKLIKELQPFSERVGTWVVHKRFCLLQKFVDTWLEPVMHQTGYDFYAAGQNIAFCNMMFYCLEGFAGKEFRDRVLSDYQQLMLNPSPQDYTKFWHNLNQMAESAGEQMKDLLKEILLAQHFLDFSHISEMGDKPNDIALTVALNTVSHWRNKYESVEIIHDQSSNMSEDTWMWETLTSSNISEQIIGYGDHRMMQLPLNVTKTSFKDSKLYPQIQLCDLVAGAAASFGRTFIDQTHRKEYGDKLYEAGILNLAINAIWPSLDVEPTEVDPNYVGNDPLDVLGGIISAAKQDKS